MANDGLPRFYGAATSGAGHVPARVVQCRVTGVNLVNYTVDVVSEHDQHYWTDIQVGSAYAHFNAGEGIYVMPDVGAVCQVCLPSDTTPKFVLSFLMPFEISNADEVANPNAGAPHPKVRARFDGGRPPIKPGDICLRGRDGNFLTLHRGGVLQVGSTELAQRIFIPIGNRVFDVSGEYEHQNTGGSIRWGIQEGPLDNPGTQHMSVYRVFANEKYCDVRIAKGKVLNPVGEPDGDNGEAEALAEMGIDDKFLVYEVALAPGGFRTGSGDLASPATRNQTKMRFFFNRDGGAFLRAEGSALYSFKKNLRVKVKETLEVRAKSVDVETQNGMTVRGGPLLEFQSDVVRLQAGTTPIARMGDGVLVPPGTPLAATIQPLSPIAPGTNPFQATIVLTTPLSGSVIGGNPNLLG